MAPPPLRTPVGPSKRDGPERISPMQRFLGLYKASAAAFEQGMKATPQQQQAGMDAWRSCAKKAGASIGGRVAPIGKTLRVTTASTAPTTNALGGHSTLQAESKEAVAEVLKGHPH